MAEHKDFVVVGAGVAGLSFAHSVLGEAKSALAVERNDHVGGLARTFRYGDFLFDVGPTGSMTDDGASPIWSKQANEIFFLPGNRVESVTVPHDHHASRLVSA